MNEEQLLERITIEPTIMVGKPAIRGTRLTVEYVLKLLASGASMDEIQREYEGLTRDDIQACILFAARGLGERGSASPDGPVSRVPEPTGMPPVQQLVIPQQTARESIASRKNGGLSKVVLWTLIAIGVLAIATPVIVHLAITAMMLSQMREMHRQERPSPDAVSEKIMETIPSGFEGRSASSPEGAAQPKQPEAPSGDDSPAPAGRAPH